jgi:hypothetical protein
MVLMLTYIILGAFIIILIDEILNGGNDDDFY